MLLAAHIEQPSPAKRERGHISFVRRVPGFFFFAMEQLRVLSAPTPISHALGCWQQAASA
jgi:hypothetical protein